MNASTPTNRDPGNTLRQVLAGRPAGRWRSRAAWLVAAGVVITLAVVLYMRAGREASTPRYRTEAAAIGTLMVTVSATGNLQPTNQVEVGSELSGIVDEVLVDDNDRVTTGQVLARLDTSKLEDAVARSRANLAAAEAQVLQERATVAEVRAVLARYRQVAELSGGKVPSRTEIDTAEANVKRAEAGVASALANVAQARASLRSDDTNLQKASIHSPIDGVVLTRQVEPGQTVAASFQAPVLFLLAENLAKMELQVDVDEADVGQVAIGQRASFTVDAWPGRRYDAVIQRVGFGSQETEGVISYRTVLDVENDDLTLRPGMTGTAQISTLTREDALLVPNAALRFSPTAATGPQAAPSRGVVGALVPRPPSQPRRVRTAPDRSSPRVWVLEAGKPVAVDVETGATDGKVTEIVGGALEAGMEVITETLGGTS